MIKTRFAPSPTGFLHLGSARTALYCYLFARAQNGQFVLRVEDTDMERSTKESVNAILEGMEWMGLSWDEGPFYQTERLARYEEVKEQLLAEGKAYKCYCTKERLESLREEQKTNKQKPKYDKHCLNRTDGEGDYVIRFKNPEDGFVTFNDLVKGEIKISNNELDDLIIYRSDGFPTYNFAVVIDDLDMGITHVIRGDDHINNTPRQINILKALNADIPSYAHLSTILGSDGKRLSKRHGAISVQQYKNEGILKEALLNYLVRLGWSHKDQEIFSIEEMIELFTLEKINNSAAAFNEEKLMWLNQHYIKTLDETYIAKELQSYLEKLEVPLENGPAAIDIVKLLKEKVKTISEMANTCRYFYEEVEYNQEAYDKFITPEVFPVLEKITQELEATEWEKEQIAKVIKEQVKESGLKFPKVAQPIRIAITGNTNSPSIDLTLVTLGKNKSLNRLKKLLEKK